MGVTFCTQVSWAQSDTVSTQPLTAKDSIALKDSATYQGTIEPTESNAITSPIFYSANDSIMTDIIAKKATLYGNAKIKSDDMELKAEEISILWEDDIVMAKGRVDSTGKYRGRPVMIQAGETMVMDSVRMNTKTKKAMIYGIEAKQGDGFLSGDVSKRTEDAIYLKEGHYTTCNLKHPHFYINARKLKVIPNDKAVCGPFNLNIEDVPTPFGFLLGYFPMMNKRKSGLIFPQFGEDINRGFYITQGGYYWAVNDYLGLKFIGDLYANGSVRLNTTATYLNRYKYNGNATIDFAGVKNQFDNSKAPRNFSIRWNHNTKQRRNSTFRASVNITSAKYFQTIAFAPVTRNSNVTNSNISYYKQFGRTPFNLSITLRGDQNVNGFSSNSTEPQAIYNAALPEVSFNMNRINPFKGKVNNNKWYEKIGVSYNGSGNYTYFNKVSVIPNPLYPSITEDTIYDITPNNLKTYILPNAKWVYSHSIPINTTFKLFKEINISPGVTYNEYWYQKKQNWVYDDSTNSAIVESKTNGFYRANQYQASITAATNIIGMYKFNSNVVKGIRHTMTPSLSYNYKPDFSKTKSWTTVEELSAEGKDGRRYLYDGTPTSRGLVSGLAFTLDNALEIKVRNRKDSTGNEFKKFKLLDNAQIRFDYNFAADSLKMSIIQLAARTQILKKFNVSYTANFDPYEYEVDAVSWNTSGKYSVSQRKVNRFLYQSKNGLARLEFLRLAVDFSLNPKAKKKNIPRPTTPEEEIQLNHALNNPAQYVDFDMPWNFNIGYNYSFTKQGYEQARFVHAVNFRGDIKFTEKWKMTVSTAYDLVNKSISTTNLNLHRDLHCWQMTFTASPYGNYKFYMFTINAKSTILQELKLNKRSSGLNTFY